MPKYARENDPEKSPFFIDWGKCKEESESLWEGLGLESDIRKGWEKAAKEDKLYSFGPCEMPFEIVESIKEDLDKMLSLAGVSYKGEFYIDYLKGHIKKLEEALEEKKGEVNELIRILGHLECVPPLSISKCDPVSISKCDSEKEFDWTCFSNDIEVDF